MSTERYDVFISYSRTNSAFAAELERELKRYRPPHGITAESERLRVFRDLSDYTGVDYFESIERHLRASSKLVVICSPEARASDYVDDEIGRFLKYHSA